MALFLLYVSDQGMGYARVKIKHRYYLCFILKLVKPLVTDITNEQGHMAFCFDNLTSETMQRVW